MVTFLTKRWIVISCQKEERKGYTSLFFKENNFLSGGELRVLLNSYVDDFEICNPLGTSRKKHKICAVHWNLSNLPAGCLDLFGLTLQVRRCEGIWL